MAGSDILDTVMYNIYGESSAPATVRTRAAKELMDCLKKVQLTREWWFSRSSVSLSVVAGNNSISIAAISAHLDTIGLVYLPITNGKLFLSRVDLDWVEKQTFQDGQPQYFSEAVDKQSISLYPTPVDSGNLTLIYRSILFPDIVTTIQAAIEAYTAPSLDLMQAYLESIVTARVCTSLDYEEKATKYANIAMEELDNLIKINADYNRQGFSFQYNGV